MCVQATDNMKVSVAHANIERNHAVQQAMRLKQELDQADRDRHAVSYSNGRVLYGEGCVLTTLGHVLGQIT